MSFFTSFVKGTFDIVQRDISAGIKSITTSETRKDKISVGAKDFNVNTGADLLHSYQENWKEIHIELDGNARKAQKVDDVIAQVHGRLDNDRDTMSEFVAQLSNLSELTNQINQIVDTISALTEQMSDTENLLVTLEDVCEQQELKTSKLNHKNQLATYSQTKNLDIEKTKVQLAKQHAKHVQQFESKLQRNLKERQEAFEATYSEEIHKYKTTGETQLKPNIVGDGPSLGDIDIGEDQSVLDQFLQSDDQDKISEAANEVQCPNTQTDTLVPESTQITQPGEEVQITQDADISDQDLKHGTSNNNSDKELNISQSQVKESTELQSKNNSETPGKENT